MTTATQTKADLEAVKDFPARAAKAMAELHEICDRCERLSEAGYPSGEALLCALSNTESLPNLDEYVAEVTEATRIALICGWDLGAQLWWFHRATGHETIDGCRHELASSPESLAAFESFNGHFEAEYPELAQKMSVSVNLTDNPYHSDAGIEALEALLPELDVALRVVVGGRHQGRLKG